MQFKVLGLFEAFQADRRVNFTPQQTRILAALILADGPVTADDLAMTVSGDAPAPGYNTMEQAVSRLRIRLREEGARASIPHRDRHEPYRLHLNGDTTDIAEFRQLLAAAEALARGGMTKDVPRAYERAIRLWRGQPLAAPSLPDNLAALRKRLEEEYLQGVIQWSDAAYLMGDLPRLVIPLAELCTRQSDSEPLSYRYALALHAAGRTSEALAEIRRLRARLKADGLEFPDQIDRLYRQLLHHDGPLSLDARPDPTSPPKLMTGRDEQIALIAKRLLAGGIDPAVVVLSGGPGVGKSALAAAAAEHIRPARPLQFEIRLQRNESAADLLARLLSLAGLAMSMPTSVAERAALLYRFLEGKDAFLLLDNVRNEKQVAAAVAAGWSAVLITSQQQLLGLHNVDVIAVKPLTDDASQSLLTQLSDKTGTTNAEAIRAIARLCAGLPLALKIAGSKLAAPRSMPAAELIARLRDARRRLDALSLGDEAVRASFLLAYEDLGSSARRLFRRMGTLMELTGDGMDHVVAAAAADLPIGAGDVLIEELIRASLVEASSPDGAHERYQLHELLAVFASERFKAEENESATRELFDRVGQGLLQRALVAERFLTIQGVHPCGPASGRSGDDALTVPDLVDRGRQAAAWLDQERATACVVVRKAFAFAGLGWVAPLGRALMPVLESRARFDMWLQLCTDLQNIAFPDADRASFDAGLGTLLHYRNDLKGSAEALNTSIEWYGRARNDLGGAYAQVMLSMTLRASQQPVSGLLDDALATAIRRQDPVLEVEALRCLSWQHRDAGDIDGALKCLQRASAVANAMPYSGRLKGYVLYDLGAAQIDRDDKEIAAQTLATAKQIFDDADDRHWSALTSVRLAEAVGERDDTQAARHLESAYEIFIEIGDQLWQAVTRRNQAALAARQGKSDEAYTLFLQAETLATVLNDERTLATIWTARGESFLLERPEHATADLKAAAEILQVYGSYSWTRRADAALARLRAAGVTAAI